MDPGGLRQLAPGLTNADAIAHAIVAAARSYGDDPELSLTTPTGGGQRVGRAVTAAISALGGPVDQSILCRIMGRTYVGLKQATQRQHPKFVAAAEAARVAVETAQAKERLAWLQALDEVEEGSAPATSDPELEPEQIAVAAEEPEPPPEARRASFGGAITSHVRPPQIQPSVLPPSAPLTDRILATLERGPRNTLSLASELGVKELVVGQCLSAMRHEKRVRSDASMGLGRAMLWVLAETAPA